MNDHLNVQLLPGLQLHAVRDGNLASLSRLYVPQTQDRLQDLTWSHFKTYTEQDARNQLERRRSNVHDWQDV